MRSEPVQRREVVAFLDDARENPDDDTPRLVLADFLIDQGDEARGEFVRLQVESARMAPTDPRQTAWQRRANQLLRQHRSDWLKPFRLGWWDEAEFERGLIRLAVSVRTLRRNSKPASRRPGTWAWVERAFVRRVRTLRQVQQLAGSAVLDQLTSLDLENAGIGPAEAQVLAESPHLARLQHLSLSSSLQVEAPGIGDAGMQALAGSPHLARLTSLWLERNDLTADGVRALAESPHLAQLRALDLGGNELGLAGVQAPAWSPYLKHLARLSLPLTVLEDEGACAWRPGRAWPV